jgi:oxaloacetate decarboxylase gamma subunit
MNIADLLTEAANLMLIGMVVVFVFLGILIVCITAMANLVGKEEPEVFNTSPKNSANAPTQSGARSDVAPEVVAAISAAVHNYRNNHDK